MVKFFFFTSLRRKLFIEIDEEFEAQLLLETEQIANQFYTSQHSDGKGLIPPEKKRKTE